MSLGFAFLYICGLFVKSTNGITSVELHFASNNCDEEPRSLSADKTYNLTWNGQITPKLCSFTFNRWDVTEICFQSILYDLQYSMGNVEVKITNYTKSAWDYNRYDDKIPRTCVQKAYKVVVSILVPTGYTAPNPKKYIELIITGVKKTDNDESSSTVVTTVIGIVVFILVAFVMFCWVRSDRQNPREVFRDILECIMGLIQSCGRRLCYCFKCKCLRGYCVQSCDCELKNICQPCGKCCSALAECCTPQHVADQAPNIRTEMHEIPADSENVQVYTSACAIGGTHVITESPPPSYESAKDMHKKIDPTIPPPSYEEVTSKTEPSAPPNVNYI